jgi:iron complex outermembrane receptor protein
MKRCLAVMAIFLCGGSLRAATSDDAAQPGPNGARGVFDLSLEQLMEVPVTGVSRKETPIARTPAAITVLTQDDIRRHGVTNLPEALRLVPGLEVARVNAHSWAIAARGFNSLYSDKLLVLLDGRVLYEARFPGVYWDAQDVVLEDVERIEVIRGPGATSWGANAVNGVINIITRAAADTPGALVSAAAGSEERPTASVRYGGRLGDRVAYRLQGKVVRRDGMTSDAGAPVHDAWDAQRVGGRVDWASGRDRITSQADRYHVDGGEILSQPLLTPPFAHTGPADFSSEGTSVRTQWRRELSPASELSLQAYYADSVYADGGDRTDDDLTDIELTHRFSPLPRHDVVWGAGYRHRASLLESATGGYLEPEHVRHLATAFLQDEIELLPKRVSMTVGTKIEHSSDSGTSLDPSVRVIWTVAPTQALWGAVSRAVRTPDLFEMGATQPVSAFPTAPDGPVMVATLVGRPDIEAESVVAYEAGYRTTPHHAVSVDVAAFYNRYDALVGFVAAAPVPVFGDPTPYLRLPLVATNGGAARTYGVEASSQWKPLALWQVSTAYSYLRPPAQNDYAEFDSPSHRASVFTTLTLARTVDLSGALYRVGALHTSPVPAYTRLDIGGSWQCLPGLEVGLWGRNLASRRHVEFPSLRTSLLEAVDRSIVATLTWRR